MYTRACLIACLLGNDRSGQAGGEDGDRILSRCGCSVWRQSGSEVVAFPPVPDGVVHVDLAVKCLSTGSDWCL